jgi:hypothetical protein
MSFADTTGARAGVQPPPDGPPPPLQSAAESAKEYLGLEKAFAESQAVLSRANANLSALETAPDAILGASGTACSMRNRNLSGFNERFTGVFSLFLISVVESSFWRAA